MTPMIACKIFPYKQIIAFIYKVDPIRITRYNHTT